MEEAKRNSPLDLTTTQPSQHGFRTTIREQNDKLIKAIDSSNYQEISQIINFIQKEINKIEQALDRQIPKGELQLQKCILLLGTTGAGKSTLLNYLAGNKLIYKQEQIQTPTGIKVRKFLTPIDSSIAAVSDGRGSTTYIPNIYISKLPELEGLTFIDFPGDFDSEGVVGEIINYVIKALIVNRLKEQVKFVFLCPQSNLGSECSYGKNLAEGLGALSNFIGSLDKFKDHVALVISHCDNTDKAIDDIKTQITSRVNSTCRKHADLLNHLIANDQIKIFCKPPEENKGSLLPSFLWKREELVEYNLPDQREKLIRLINSDIKFKDFKDDSFNFSPSFSSEANKTVLKTAEIIKDEINTTLEGEISRSIGQKFRKLQTSDEFANFIEELKQLVASLFVKPETTIEEYATELNKFLQDQDIQDQDIKVESFSKLLESLHFAAQFTNDSDGAVKRFWKINIDDLLQRNPDAEKVFIQISEIPRIKKEITETLQIHITNNKQYIGIRPDKLEDFQKSIYQLITQGSTIDQYIKTLNENKFLPRIKTERFDELSAKLEAASQRIGNPKICQEAWGKELIEIFNQITTEIHAVSEVEKLHDKDKFLQIFPFRFQEEEQEITYIGYSVKISEVIKKIQSYLDSNGVEETKGERAKLNAQHFTHLRIFALSEVILDTNLRLPSCNVTILAPTWNIKNNITINLRGKDGAADFEEKSDGTRSGSPGYNGGHFLGIGEKFINPRNLTVDVSGGEGSPGKKGKDGVKGEDQVFSCNTTDDIAKLLGWLEYVSRVKDTIYDSEFQKFIEKLLSNKIQKIFDKLKTTWSNIINVILKGNVDAKLGNQANTLQKFFEVAIEAFTETNQNTQRLPKKNSKKAINQQLLHEQLKDLGNKVCNDHPLPLLSTSMLRHSSIGGDAEAGGKGGTGGHPGTYKIIGLDTLVKTKSIVEQGEKGKGGDTGNVGAGGIITLNITDLSVKPTSCCAFKRQAIKTKTYQLNAPQGIISYEQSSIDQESPKPSIEVPSLSLSLLDYEMLLGQKSEMAQKLLKSFCQKFKNHPTVVSETKTNEEGFINELLKLEAYISTTKYDFVPFYHSIASRIASYANSLNHNTAVLKYLYTFTLSRLTQLESASQSRLVVDMDGFLKKAEKHLKELQENQKLEKIKAYKKEYVQEIKNKIDESTSFIKILVEDVKNYSKALDKQTSEYLKEIEKGIELSIDNTINLHNKNQKLQRIIIKSSLLDVIALTSSAASNLPLPGVAVIFNVVGSCIDLINKPRISDTEELIKKLDQLHSAWNQGPNLQDNFKETEQPTQPKNKSTKDKVKRSIQNIRLAIEAAGNLSKKFLEKRYDIPDVKTTILKAQSLLEELQKHREYTINSFKARLEEITSQIEDMQYPLNDMSIIALQFNKLEAKNFFKSIKAEISNIVKQPDSKDGFINILDKMVEVIETSIYIGEYVEEYKEHIALAEYIADVNSTDMQTFREGSPELNEAVYKLETIKQRNIILEQYYSAVSLIKQWAFPFAYKFVKDFDVSVDIPDEKFKDAITTKMQGLITKVWETKTFITGDIDNPNKQIDFIDQPFFIWSYDNYSQEITDLLNGKQVFLYADIKQSPELKAAIKFMEIRLEIKINDEVVHQNDLKTALRHYTIQLQHSGNSYYRFADNIYSINHTCLNLTFSADLQNYNDTFQKIHESSKNNPMISPYALWGIKLTKETNSNYPIHSSLFNTLEPQSTLYNKFKNIVSKFEIHLIGRGKYVDENLIRIPQEQLDAHYNKAHCLMPLFTMEEQINQTFISKYNAFNQRHNPDYYYQSKDIETIQHELMQEYKKDFIILPPIHASYLDTLKKAIDNLDDRPILCICDVGELDWTTLAISRYEGNNKIALYKDPCGNENSRLSSQLINLGIRKFLHSTTNEQQDNSPACGILALRNMQIIAKQIIFNKESFIKSFEKDYYLKKDFIEKWIYSDFSNLDSIDSFRKDEFAKMYVLGKYEQIKDEKETLVIISKIQEYHHPELIDLAQKIQNLGYSTKIIGTNDDIDQSDLNVVTLEIFVASVDKIRSSYSYCYKIHIIDNPEANTITNKISKTLKLKYERDNLSLIIKKPEQSLDGLLFLPIIIDFSELALEISQEDTASKELIKNLYDTKDRGLKDLYTAALNCNLKALQSLIDKGISLDVKDDFGRTLLHWAVFNNSIKAIRLLLEKGANINNSNNNGETPLYWAARKGCSQVAKLLLENEPKADIEAPNQNGWTPLNSAAYEGHLEVVKELLNKGAKTEVATNEDGVTPLGSAANNGHLEVVKELLSKGANIEAKNKDGRTPLNSAANNGHLEVVKELLSKGANIEAKNKDGWTPLLAAVYQDHIDVIQALLSNETKPNIEANKDGATPLFVAAARGHFKVVEILLNNRAEIEAADNYGTTPLLIAARHGHLSAVKVLLEKGANIKAKDNYGTTPLLIAARHGHLSAVKVLLEKGANIKAKDNDGTTPLLIATAKSHLSVIEELLEKGADIEAKDNYGTTPLLIAARYGLLQIVEALLERGANIEAIDHYDTTPLLTAVENNHFIVTKILLEKGADFEALNNYCSSFPYLVTRYGLEAFDILKYKLNKNTPLMTAARKGDIEAIKGLLEKGSTTLLIAAQQGDAKTVKELLEKGADIEATGEDGETPLMTAARYSKHDVVQLLLDNKANIEATNKYHKETPLIIAARNNYKPDVINALLKRDANIKAVNKDNKTPLHLAAENGSTEVVKALLNNNIKPNLEVVDKNGNTPLHLAAQNNRLEVVQELLREGANIEAVDKNGNTPLHLAAQNNRLEVVQELLREGANIEVANKYNSTPLYLATKSGHTEIVKKLLDNKAKPNTKGKDGDTPLHLAIKVDYSIKGELYGSININVVKLLLENEADCNIQNNNGDTPLHLALKNKDRFGLSIIIDINVVKLLLENKADCNIQNNNGDTPLHLTLTSEINNYCCKLDMVVKALLEKGANKEIKNKDGNIPLHLAASNRSTNTDIVKLLVHDDLILKANKDGKTPLDLALSSIYPIDTEVAKLVGDMAGGEGQEYQLL